MLRVVTDPNPQLSHVKSPVAGDHVADIHDSLPLFPEVDSLRRMRTVTIRGSLSL